MHDIFITLKITKKFTYLKLHDPNNDAIINKEFIINYDETKWIEDDKKYDPNYL